MNLKELTKEELVDHIRGLEARLDFYENQSAVEQKYGQAVDLIREAFAAWPEPTLIWERAGDQIMLLRANEAVSDLLSGYMPAEPGRPVEEVLAQYPEMIAHIHTVLETGRPSQAEISFGPQHLNRSIWMEANHVAVPGGRVLTVLTNITSRKLAEQALRHSEQKYRHLAEQSNEGIFIVDATGGIIEWNAAMERITGLPALEALGRMSWNVQFMLVPQERRSPELLSRFRQAILALLSGSTADHFNSHREYEIERPDGQRVMIQITSYEIDTRRERMIGSIVRDVTASKQNERRLEESEQRFRMVSEMVSDYAFALDIGPQKEMSNIWATDAFKRITSYTVEEVIENGWQRVIYSDDWPAAEQHFARTMLGKEDTCELRIVTRSRQIRWLVSYLQPVWSQEENRVTRIYGACQDITARREVEIALQQSESRLRSVYNALEEAVLLLTPDRVLMHMNPAAERIFGYGLPDLVGRSAGSLHQDEVHAEQFAHFASLALAQKTSFLFEGQSRRQNGEYFPAEHTLAPLKTEDGQLLGLVDVVRDITERKRADEQIRASEERYRSLTELSPDVIAVVVDNQLAYINPAGIRLLGAGSLDEIRGTPLDSFLHTGSAPGAGNPPNAFTEHRIATVDGRMITFEAAFAPYNSADGPAYLIVGRDITERKRAGQELEQRNRELAALLTLSEKIADQHDLDRLLHTVTQVIAETLPGAEAATIWMDSPDPAYLSIHAWAGLEEANTDARIPKSGEALPAWIYEYGQSRLINHAADNPACQYIANVFPGPVLSVLGVPLKIDDRPIGCLIADSTRAGVFDENDHHLLLSMASQVSIAIQRARLFKEVEKARQRLKALSHKLVAVQEAERQHLARELHDEIGQLLTGLNLKLGAASRSKLSDAHRMLTDAQALVNDLTNRVRDLSLDLRPSMLDDLGLLPALLWHIERYTDQTGIKVNLKHTGVNRRMESGIEITAYRIIQEALTNAARHAAVSEVDVRLWANETILSVRIEDSGPGFNIEQTLAQRSTGGLDGMQERVDLLGGNLMIQSGPAGTQITADFPLGGQNSESKWE